MSSTAAAGPRIPAPANIAAGATRIPTPGKLPAGLLVLAGLCLGGPAPAAPPDPLLPLIHRVESFVRRGESSGVAMDPRFSLNPSEVARLTVVCQLLGYADLYLA